MPERWPIGGGNVASLRNSVLLFCCTVFFFWTSLYLFVPVLPAYTQSLGASMTMVGVVLSAYAVFQLLLRIPIGVGADLLGRRKPFVIGGIVAAFIGAIWLGLSPNPWMVYLGRSTTGIGAATWVIFTVYFSAYYPREQVGRAIAIISFVNGIALVVGTGVGGALAQLWGFRPVFFIAAALQVLALILLMSTQEVVAVRTKPVSLQSFTRVATHPRLLTVALMTVLVQFVSYAGVFGFIPVYGAEIGASRADLGIITMLALGAGAVASLGTIYMVKRIGNSGTVLVGSLLQAFALFAIPSMGSVYLLEAVQVFNGAGRGLVWTTLLALSIRDVAPEERATAMGVFQAIFAIGMLAGPLVSGVLADSLSLASVFYVSAALSLVVGGMSFLRIVPGR